MAVLTLRVGRFYAECVRNCLDGSLKGLSAVGITRFLRRQTAAIHVGFTQLVVSKLACLAKL